MMLHVEHLHYNEKYSSVKMHCIVLDILFILFKFHNILDCVFVYVNFPSGLTPVSEEVPSGWSSVYINFVFALTFGSFLSTNMTRRTLKVLQKC